LGVAVCGVSSAEIIGFFAGAFVLTSGFFGGGSLPYYIYNYSCY